MTLLEVLREQLLEAGRVYARESAGGARPLEAGARLRLAAKAFEQAEREASERRAIVVREGRVQLGLPISRTEDAC